MAPARRCGDAKASADADYKAALEACDTKTGAMKESCQKDAKAAHEHAMGKKDTSTMGAPQSSMGAGKKLDRRVFVGHPGAEVR